MAKKIPIVLITGFLGAGKTTFINWLLEHHADKKISVILNEFGDIQLESQFVKQHSEEIIELANGCMCCVTKSDIPRVLRYILEHSPQTEYLLIEASGLSDPEPIREALQSPPISDAAFLESTVCLIDAVNFETNRLEHRIITAQMADANLIVVSKGSLITSAQLELLQSLLKRLTPDIEVLVFNESLSPAIFLVETNPTSKSSSAKPLPSQPTAKSGSEHIHDHYQMYWYQSEASLDIDQVLMFLKTLPNSVIRIKGVIKCQVENVRDQKVLVQRVGQHVTVEEDQWNDQEVRQTTLLFIGTNFDESLLKTTLSTLEAT